MLLIPTWVNIWFSRGGCQQTKIPAPKGRPALGEALLVALRMKGLQLGLLRGALQLPLLLLQLDVRVVRRRGCAGAGRRLESGSAPAIIPQNASATPATFFSSNV